MFFAALPIQRPRRHTVAPAKVALGLRSTEPRATKIASTVPDYAAYRPYRVALEELLAIWVRELDAASTNVGLNWSGPSAQGTRVTTHALVRGVQARRWELEAPERAARRAAEWSD